MTQPVATTERYFVFGDLHGEYEKFCKTLALITEKAGFDLKKGDCIVSLGDKNDRGPDTFEVIEWFRNAEMQYPEHVICIMGNHEMMMLDAARMHPYGDIFWLKNNGGPDTLKSYSKHTQFYGKRSLGNSLVKTGHAKFIQSHMLFLETDDYFFCHAPIPRERYRRLAPGFDFRCDVGTLTWSCPPDGIFMERWIEPKLIPKEVEGNFYGDHKLCVYGHLHGIKVYETTGPYGRKDYDYVIPGVRKYGNAVLLDTGAGCVDHGYVTCPELPSGNLYNSNGEISNLKDLPDLLPVAEEDAWLRD
jgi:hypothetical protein